MCNDRTIILGYILTLLVVNIVPLTNQFHDLFQLAGARRTDEGISEALLKGRRAVAGTHLSNCQMLKAGYAQKRCHRYSDSRSDLHHRPPFHTYLYFTLRDRTPHWLSRADCRPPRTSPRFADDDTVPT